MPKLLLLLVSIVSAAATVMGQAPTQSLKKVAELKMPLTAEDEMPGTRGASVAWHPIQKKYYASFAGNVDFPMGVFDATGKRVSADELKTQADTRGLWYDPAKKTIAGNGYSDFGWFS